MLGKILGRSSDTPVLKGRRSSDDALRSRISDVIKREQPNPVDEENRPRIRVELEELRPAQVQQEVIEEEDQEAEAEQQSSSENVASEPVEIDDDAETLHIVECIYLSREVVESLEPYDAIRLNSDIVGYLLNELHYQADEVRAESYQCYALDQYIQLVLNGGHADFIAAFNDNESVWQAVREALSHLPVRPHQRIFDDFISFIVSNPELAEQIAENGSAGEAERDLELLDEKLIEADHNDPIYPKLGEWLCNLPCVHVLEREALDSTINTLASQAAVLERHEEFLKSRQAENERDPLMRIGYTIAQRAGLEFERWGDNLSNFEDEEGQVWPDGRIMITNVEPAVMVRSDEGQYSLFCYDSKKELAVLALDDGWDA